MLNPIAHAGSPHRWLVTRWEPAPPPRSYPTTQGLGSHRGPGSSSQGPGVQLMGARDPAHGGSESSIWRLGLLPASDLDISASFHSKRQRGQEVHQRPDGLKVRPDDHPIWKSRPAAALCSVCLLCSVQPVTKCVLGNAVTWQDDTRRELAYKDSALYGCLLFDFKILVPH